MAAQSDLVSVIIPVFNGERFLAETIESVLDQSYKPIEIIVVDDGSNDRTAQIARSYDGISYFKQTHQGVAAARNYGIAKAHGEYLSFVDADDLWHKDKIKRQISNIWQNNSFEGLVCRFENFFEPNVELPGWLNKEYFVGRKFKDMPSLCTLLIRVDDFMKVGKFNTNLETGEDIDWFARAKDKGMTIKLMHETLVYRRLHDLNLSYKAHDDRKDLLKIFKASLDRKRFRKG